MARSLGLGVPEDLSIVGFDDHDLSEALGLTTVAQPVRTIGELAALQLAGLVVGAAHGHGHPPVDRVAAGANRVIVPTMLVVRGSTAPPAGGPPAPGRGSR